MDTRCPRTRLLAALACSALSLVRPALAQAQDATIPAPGAEDATSSTLELEARDPTVAAPEAEAADATVPEPVSQPHTVAAAPQSSAATGAPRPSSAVDDERPPDSAPGRTWKLHWYGYQTLLADALALGLIVGTGEGTLVVLGLGGALLAAPIIHFVHGNAWGYLSLALRALAATLGFVGLVNAISDDEERGHSCSEACLEAGPVTYAGTVLLDGLVFSMRIEQPARSRDRAQLGPLLAPDVVGAAARVVF